MNIPVSCENCGQPALETDVTCWHCGRSLPGRETAAMVASPAKELWSDSRASHVGLYLASTITVFLVLLLVMGALGRRPTLQIGLRTRVPGGWVRLISSREWFTVLLPEDWEIYDAEIEEQAAALGQVLAAEPGYLQATYPLGTESSDLDVLFLGRARHIFLVVVRSAMLNRVTYDEASRFLERPVIDVDSITFIDNFQKTHLSIEVERPVSVEAQSGRFLCNQQFILGQEEAMLVSLCVASGHQSGLSGTTGIILDSFQRLHR